VVPPKIICILLNNYRIQRKSSKSTMTYISMRVQSYYLEYDYSISHINAKSKSF